MELRVKSLRRTFVVTVPLGATAEQVRACLPPALSTDKQFLSGGDVVQEKDLLRKDCRELLLVRAKSEHRSIAVHITQAYNSFTLYCSADTSVLQLSQACLHRLDLDPAFTRLLHNSQVLSEAIGLGELTPLPSLDIHIESANPVRPSQSGMALIIKFLTGASLQISVDPRITVRELKQVIGEQAQASTLGLRLIFAGRELYNHTPLYKSGAGGGSTFHAVYRLPGG